MVVGRGIVDRQQLNHLHPRQHRPVHQAFQVTKVAHTIAMF